VEGVETNLIHPATMTLIKNAYNFIKSKAFFPTLEYDFEWETCSKQEMPGGGERRDMVQLFLNFGPHSAEP